MIRGMRASALGLGLALVLALLLGGCAGKTAGRVQPGSGSGSGSGSHTTSSGSTGKSEPAPDPGYGAPREGDCHRMTAAASLASVDTSHRVRCSSTHTSVVARVGYLPRPITPATPVAKRRAVGKRLCQPAYQRVAGGTLADRATSILTWTLFTPDQAQLERGARWVRCDVVARSADTLVRLPGGRPLLAHGVPESLRICQTATGSDVSCSQPHAFRVEAVYQAVGRSYPNTTAYTPVARARCRQLMGSFGGYWQPPSPAGWAAGDRFVRCLRPTKG